MLINLDWQAAAAEVISQVSSYYSPWKREKATSLVVRSMYISYVNTLHNQILTQ